MVGTPAALSKNLGPYDVVLGFIFKNKREIGSVAFILV